MTHEYSDRWFTTFLEPIPPEQTRSEVAFLARQLPLPGFRRILDLACGPGRHASALAEAGYDVTGVDVHRPSLTAARARAGPGARFVQADMRDLRALPEDFDGVTCMWQNFGHFDAATNARVLRQAAGRLRAEGRLVLDLYHRKFFEANQGVRRHERSGVVIEEWKAMRGDRLDVRIRYGGDGEDRFEWQLYTPEALVALAGRCGFRPILGCREFDASRPASPERPRMQWVFGKVE
ncbi:MAG: methyltransferase domain-containing protein [Gemmatimonadota bacterium]